MNKLYILLFCLFSFCISAQDYTDVSISSGVGFDHAGLDGDMDIGTGAAWFDYDNDGHLDLYVTNRVGANKLFHNNGDGTFTDTATAMGVADSSGDGSGVVAGDINGDGWIDLYLANSSANVLFLNSEGTSFTDITVSSGINSIGDSRSTSATFGDYDNDGNLDIYVSHHLPVGDNPASTTKDFLFHNNGDLTFTDVSAQLNDSLLMDVSFIGAWTDMDRDGDQDLVATFDCEFVGFDNHGTLIYTNDGGPEPIFLWKFVENSVTHIQDDCSNVMGIGVGDYNRDGWMDIVYSNVGPAVLFKNNNGIYEEDTDAGIDIQATSDFSWGTSFMDYDNDGWQDIALSLGSLSLAGAVVGQANNFFHNNGDGTFDEIAEDIGVADTLRTRTMIHADYDNDGDLDILMVNYNDAVRLMRNDAVNSNHYFRIELESRKSAPHGIGARIMIKDNLGIKQYFEMVSGSNLGGGDEIIAHFGLGAATMIDSIVVDWLSGSQSILTNEAGDNQITIVEPNPYLYVRESATGINDGSNWINAFNKLTDALAAVTPGDTILVADGSYYPTETTNEALSFVIPDSVSILGGFPTSGGSFASRDLIDLGTILTGFIGEQNSSTEYSYNVISVPSTTTMAYIEGLAIQDGKATGPLSTQQQGGGIHCAGVINGSHILLQQNTSTLDGSHICVTGATSILSLTESKIVTSDLTKPVITILDNGKTTILENVVIEEE